MGKPTQTTKFVDWPVVDKIPARTLVLYSGHWYSFGSAGASSGGGIVTACTGTKWTTGRSRAS